MQRANDMVEIIRTAILYRLGRDNIMPTRWAPETEAELDAWRRAWADECARNAAQALICPEESEAA